jgi:hypothetical protein
MEVRIPSNLLRKKKGGSCTPRECTYSTIKFIVKSHTLFIFGITVIMDFVRHAVQRFTLFKSEAPVM